MPVTTIKVYFTNPAITQVIIVQMSRKKNRKKNPHRPVRMKVAALEDPSQPQSEENTWTTKFGTSSVPNTEKTVFQALGLDAQGNIVASFAGVP
ncbi:MAG TPA: hypothetical protein VG122_08230 [Gemmata sp.]|jgi:hypothetical protein|nr:hypothetical protein [Gemmata sp.]